MTILQMHIGKMSELRQWCVASVHEKYPEAEYAWIDEVNLDEWTQNTLRYYGETDAPKTWLPPFSDIVTRSDWIRFAWLAGGADRMWIDTDCEIIQRFDAFAGDAPYIGGHKFPDLYWIYNNGNLNWFNDWARRVGNLTHKLNGGINEDKSLSHFPDSCFKHYGSPCDWRWDK